MADLPPITPDPVIEAYKRDIDMTQLRENLKLTVSERFAKHMQFQRLADELRRAGAEYRESTPGECGGC
jgi:hypothetical protein